MTTTGKADYWSLRGLPPGSDNNQLKRAFRREARKWHPDLNKDDKQAEERFKLVNEAYAILSDPLKRKAWENNEEHLSGKEELFATGFPSYEEYIELVLGIVLEDDEDIHYEEFREDYVNDIPDEYAPTTTTQTPPPVPLLEDLETLVDLSVEEALYGSVIEVQLNDSTIVEVPTPPFAGDGWRLRIAGAAIGNKDHFIQLRVQTEDGLRIDGLRVLYKLELFPPDALIGCAVEIPTLNGPVNLQVPPGSSSGRLLRLRGRGLRYENLKGDQIVEIVIVLPSESSDSEIALYKRLQEIANEDI